MRIVDVSSPSAPPELGAFRVFGGPVYGVAVEGNIAYVTTERFGGLRVVDVSNPAAPTELGSCCSSWEGRDVAVMGTTAYVAATPRGVLIGVISIPTAPSEVGLFLPTEWVLDVAVMENTAYLLCGDEPRSAGLRIADVSSPSEPTLVGSLDTPGTAITVEGSIVYIAGGLAGLRLVDVTNPAAPAAGGLSRHAGIGLWRGSRGEHCLRR